MLISILLSTWAFFKLRIEKGIKNSSTPLNPNFVGDEQLNLQETVATCRATEPLNGDQLASSEQVTRKEVSSSIFKQVYTFPTEVCLKLVIKESILTVSTKKEAVETGVWEDMKKQRSGLLLS